jgi:hypothetical protein
MKLTYPGAFLTFLLVLSLLALGAVVYYQWWLLACFVAPVVVGHVGILFRIRAAAWLLVVLYALGCISFAYRIATATTFSPLPWRDILKLAFNLCVLHELRMWFRRVDDDQ